MEISIRNRFVTLGHDRRLAVFRLLARRYPDAVPAGEIARALDLKANTLSVYLGALTQSGLISQTRQGASLLYRADWDAVRQMVDFLVLDCCRGRPDLCLSLDTVFGKGNSQMVDRKLNALFVCTGNSARSIFAEALLRHHAGDRFNVYSAGTRPYSELNPLALEMLADKGFETVHLRAKNISEFQAEDAPVMDFVFTVCDRAANEDCATWPGQPISAHWGVADPVKAKGTEAQKRLAFQQAFGQLRNRIRTFAALPFETLDRRSLQHHVDEIARTQEQA
jgi:arsenate reductase